MPGATAGHPRKPIWWKYLFFEESHSKSQILTVGKFTKNKIYCCVIRFLIYEYTTHNHIRPGTIATWNLFCNHKNNVWEQKCKCLNWEYKYCLKFFKPHKTSAMERVLDFYPGGGSPHHLHWASGEGVFTIFTTNH